MFFVHLISIPTYLLNVHMHYMMCHSSVVLTQVHDLVHFFPPSGNQLNFIWGSTNSGFMHLYHVTVALEPSASETLSPDDTGFNNMSLHPSEIFLFVLLFILLSPVLIRVKPIYCLIKLMLQ